MIFVLLTSFLIQAQSVCQSMEVANLRLEIHAMNIENMYTSKTSEGDVYHVRSVECDHGKCQVKRTRKVRIQFDPQHPDANAAGYVELPKISLAKEMAALDLAISRLKYYAKNGFCKTEMTSKLSESTVRYSSDSNVLEDQFRYNEKGELVSWLRKYSNQKSHLIDFSSVR